MALGKTMLNHLIAISVKMQLTMVWKSLATRWNLQKDWKSTWRMHLQKLSRRVIMLSCWSILRILILFIHYILNFKRIAQCLTLIQMIPSITRLMNAILLQQDTQQWVTENSTNNMFLGVSPWSSEIMPVTGVLSKSLQP